MISFEEVVMAKRAGAYKSEKRKKELMRQKKQQEKRNRRLFKPDGTPQDVEIADSTDAAAGADQAATETETKE
jgi:hypothetical protein